LRAPDWYTERDTMARILKHWRTLAAGAFSLALIASVVLIARDIDSPRAARALVESELLKAIATQDTDGDGLPDWEEALYGADPNKVDTFGLGISDKEAVAQGLVVPKAVANIEAGSANVQNGLSFTGLTAAFIGQLYAQYSFAYEKNKGILSDEDLLNIVETVFNAFSDAIELSGNFITREDLTVSDSGQEALRIYAERVEAILKNGSQAVSDTETEYLRRAVQEDDFEALVSMEEIAEAYRSAAAGIVQVSVPKELAGEMLRFVNALARLGGISLDFARVKTDPLATMLALSQYPEAVSSLVYALVDIRTVYEVAGVSFVSGMPGNAFVNQLPGLLVQQKKEYAPQTF
jgi:hypothetical protein